MNEIDGLCKGLRGWENCGRQRDIGKFLEQEYGGRCQISEVLWSSMVGQKQRNVSIVNGMVS
jgi:hypothetical protein